ncbi:hypothetical protein [Actinomadura geliboluensis]|uniref:Uncharacterized protein n=1 Tax=Actinomadura geliboluensis TaxID=882440 RepID=A0A5S4H6N2_9ACTN|nr:hypothetical protein [Actinomadura geliboluensis]TMR40893.1 hypothetical protein ETD96_08415 [Actinomadura geliboluensis]
MTVSRAVIGRRLHQTATTWDEICRLLNTSIPFAQADQIDFTPYPLATLLAVSRKLDLPLTTLVPELKALIEQENAPATAATITVTSAATSAAQRDREAQPPARGRPAIDMAAFDMAASDVAASDVAASDVAVTGGDASDVAVTGGDASATDTAPSDSRAALWDSSSLDQRGMIVLTALAHAACPLDATAIAQALDVPLADTTQTLAHLLRHPHLGGPMRLRPVPPDLYELRPRVDLVDSDQLLMLKTMDASRDGMTAPEALALRAAIDLDHPSGNSDITAFLNEHPQAAARLVRRGYLQPPALTDDFIVDPDVINSLRRPSSAEEEAFLRVRSPQRSDPGNDPYGTDESNAFPLRPVGYEALSSRTPATSDPATSDPATSDPGSGTEPDSSGTCSPGEDTPT